MKIKGIALSAAYVGQRVVKAICVGAQEIWSAIKYIKFADPVVAQICATNFGDGSGLTEEDAAKVTSIGLEFNGNTEIVSFDEFEKFVNVTNIPAWAFSGCKNLSSIILPPNVITINDGAFWENNFISFEIPSKVTKLDGRVLYGCSALQSIVVPNSLVTISGQTFQGCTALKSVHISNLFSWLNITISTPEGNPLRYSADLYLNNILLEDVVIPNGVTEIKRYSFWHSTIKSVTIPNSVTKIEQSFTYCKNLLYVDIPESIAEIGGWCFYDDSKLSYVICRAVTPPTLGQQAFDGTNNPIYVPDESVEAYKAASNWSTYANRIKPLSEYQQ